MKSDSLHINEDEFPEAKPRFFHGWYLVAASWIMLFLVSAVAVNIFFKPILEEFGWDRTTLSLVHTIGLLFFSLVSPFLGRLIDRFGPRVMLFICVATQTLSSVTNGLATHLWHLYIGRFLYDIKGMHASQVLINRWFVKKRGLAQGIVATGVPAGMLVLSPLSQYLVLAWGWRQTLLFWAGVTFVILLPLTVRIRENPADTGFAPDGEPLSRGTGDNRHIQPGSVDSSPPDIFQESSTLGEVLRSSSLWLLLATQFICGIGCGFMMTHIVIFATDIGYSAMIGAAFLSVQGGANIIGVLLTGYVSDRLSRSRVLALTHFVRSLSFVTIALTVFYAGGSLWLLFVAMALFGFGYFTTAPLSSGLVADLFGYKRMGLLIGIILSCHMVGSALGAAAGGIIFESTGSYYPFFPIQGILEFVAAVFAFAIKRQAAR